ncbi:MAG: Dyp-type peroxidase [Gammaproteobacteria bacterium]|nr:Dyp-type peroxidase [Gammaproteobacteria bacterium]
MNTPQPGILDEIPLIARYISFSLLPDTNPQHTIQELPGFIDGASCVVGIGAPLTTELGAHFDGLPLFPNLVANGISIPSTQSALWCWLRGHDRGDMIHQTLQLENRLSAAFEIDDIVDAFQYGESRDLSGYEDGTENPVGDEAADAAIVQHAGPGMDGSSFVAVQRWVHDLTHFQSFTQDQQDNIFGRRKSDNEELEDAPESAHVKRTAQESFDPEAFIVRRSMPWCDANEEGLMFVAFGHSFDAFETLLRQMMGINDGIKDGLFRFTRPVSGAYYWCPPMKDGILDLSILK